MTYKCWRYNNYNIPSRVPFEIKPILSKQNWSLGTYYFIVSQSHIYRPTGLRLPLDVNAEFNIKKNKLIAIYTYILTILYTWLWRLQANACAYQTYYPTLIINVLQNKYRRNVFMFSFIQIGNFNNIIKYFALYDVIQFTYILFWFHSFKWHKYFCPRIRMKQLIRTIDYNYRHNISLK